MRDFVPQIFRNSAFPQSNSTDGGAGSVRSRYQQSEQYDVASLGLE